MVNKQTDYQRFNAATFSQLNSRNDDSYSTIATMVRDDMR